MIYLVIALGYALGGLLFHGIISRFLKGVADEIDWSDVTEEQEATVRRLATFLFCCMWPVMGPLCWLATPSDTHPPDGSGTVGQ